MGGEDEEEHWVSVYFERLGERLLPDNMLIFIHIVNYVFP